MLPLSPQQITRLYQDALAQQGKGQVAEAAETYRRILTVKPDIAEVHFQLGRIALTGRDGPGAAAHFERAAGLKPAEAAIWQGWAEAAALAADPALTRHLLARAKALKLPPKLLIALQDRLTGTPARKAPGIGRAAPAEVKALLDLFNAGRMAEAEARAAAILTRAPDAALVADVLGNARMNLGKPESAAEAFGIATRLAPDWAEAQNNLGHALLALGRLDAAQTALERSVALSPKLALAHRNLGKLWLDKGDKIAAVAALKRAVEADPKLAEAQVMLGRQLLAARSYASAESALRAALDVDPRRPETLLLLGQLMAAQGEEDAALDWYDRGLALAPDHLQLLVRKALLLQGQGKFDAAEALFRHAITVDPDAGDVYRLFLTAKKIGLDDPMVAEMETRIDAPGLSDEARMGFGFALSKVMEDNKRHDRVMPYLHTANALMRKAHPFDIATLRREIEGIMRAFDGFTLPEPLPGATDYAPIFVTGMPRSGTTLVEQIIASHSRVTGAGEIGVGAREAFRTLCGDGRGNFTPIGQVPAAEIVDLGHRYEAALRTRFPQAIQISDKSIQTYAFMGVLAQALPAARFVVVRRDPRDTLLSIYKNVFLEGTHLYAYNLRDLGLYYRLFVELIDFWRARMPGRFYEVRYEALVAEPEAQSRALIAACGMEWEESCLNFHQNTRRVETLSVFQVRQPIYASSMKSWQRYPGELDELYEALGIGPDDVA
ncbi:sulfotransferase [Paracoccaceae bacterium Fryx2]|nr:sulfotransferase [Paracoccaceae bacterium Fryx2]